MITMHQGHVQYIQGGVWNGGLIRATVLACVVVLSVLFAQPADAVQYAGVTVRIETPEKTVADVEVTISDAGCTVQDNKGVSTTITGFSALCALDAAAKQEGLTYELVTFGTSGLFVNAIAGTVSNANTYWLYYVNTVMGSVGIKDWPTRHGDELLLSYGNSTTALRLTVDRTHRRTGEPMTMLVETSKIVPEFKAAQFYPVPGATVTITQDGTIQTVTTDPTGRASFALSSPGSAVVVAEATGSARSDAMPLTIYTRHSSPSAVGVAKRNTMIAGTTQFLRSEVNQLGAELMGSSLVEWVAMGLGAAQSVPRGVREAVEQYDPTVESGTFELSRHILALEALGLNPHNFNGVNYVQRLFDTMDTNVQFGDPSFCNDDVFSVLALLSAGMDPYTEGLQQGIAYTLKCFTSDGGMSYARHASTSDVDSTAAWLMMIGRYSAVANRLTDEQYAAQQSALEYLRTTQNPDGGWGWAMNQPSNTSSTAWALMGLQANDREAKATTTNYRNGFHFLLSAWDSKSGQMNYDTLGTPSSTLLNSTYALMALTNRPVPVNVYIKPFHLTHKAKNRHAASRPNRARVHKTK